MATTIFQVCRMLEAARLHFFIERDRGSDTIRLTATFVGERAEIDVFEDGHIEISRFRGDESIEGGIDLLRDLIEHETKDC